MTALARHLGKLRSDNGLGIRLASEAIGIRPKELTKYERGFAMPPPDVLERFAAAYGVTVDSIIEHAIEAQMDSVETQEGAADVLTKPEDWPDYDGGFWMKTPTGTVAHINGDPNMDKETAQALAELIDAAWAHLSKQAEKDKEQQL